MASSCRHFPFIIFLALSFSLHAHGRDTQFFSKLTNNNNNGNAQESDVQVPNKSEPQSLSQNEPEPNFVPDTQNGYGLYGHESGQLPPSATTSTPYAGATNYHPYKTQPGGPYRVYTTSNSDNHHNRNYYSNKDSYETSDPQPQGMSDTRFMHRGYATRPSNNNYYNGGGGGGDAAATNTRNYYYGGGGGGNGNGYNRQQEGMSDTRFLENGRYYYDVKNDENYGRGYGNSRGFEYKKGYYGNNQNSYEYNQNQEEFEEGSQDEFEP
ncbi:hypothetical protein U1Q18_009227 [Sarracenia purpurea var. burkii]